MENGTVHGTILLQVRKKRNIGQFSVPLIAESRTAWESFRLSLPRKQSLTASNLFEIELHPLHGGRKVIQIEVVADQNEPAMVDIFALCDDGSIWRRGIGTGRHTGLIDDQWERIPLDGLEDIAPENAFKVVIEASH